ncbi:MAG TPA: choice-of-anchor tandem repeat GloVer-containing protein, partial [Blastocatellia bacterium]
MKRVSSPSPRLSLCAICLVALVASTAFSLLISANNSRARQTGSNGTTDHRSPNYLVQIPDGLLIGTAPAEAAGDAGAADRGIVFAVNASGEMAPLHVFEGADGADPSGSLLYGSDGFIYGVTAAGGASGLGTIYRIGPDGSGFEVVHSFDGKEGSAPLGGLIQGPGGELYGTTSHGGSGQGTIFAASEDGQVTVLHSFSGGDGAGPASALMLGNDGLLYGATKQGGVKGQGSIFRVATDGSSYQSLHSFTGPDGSRAASCLVQTADGTLFGAAASGGAGHDGVLFKLSPDGSQFTVEHSFGGYDSARPAASDGAKPVSIVDGGDGFLYGVTKRGGRHDLGTVYQLDPETGQTVIVFSFTDRRSAGAGIVGGTGGLYVASAGRGTMALESLAGKVAKQSKSKKGIITPQAIDMVTTNADTGSGSLRTVIADAASGDTITFAAALDGLTITLTSGEILINKNLTITGPGSGMLSISGSNSSRIFFISTGTVSISGLTLENGMAKGGNGGNSALGGGGGGAAGMGGDIFVFDANLTLADVTCNNSEALGGNGGGTGGTGGNGGGGGGIGGNGANATATAGGNGGSGGNLGGSGGTGGTSSPTTSGSNGGSGAGGGGGGGRTTGGGANGGTAGFGGGGGGSGEGTAGGTAGNGGFGG